ncbi:SepA family multidrug efflux transporter [Macrococcus hajekii]|uniref:Multidrug resistance efflux pump SepA n=1 Tax=Macrococcus hajekii TaxID=198482 RepID=A0A4R6BJF4_9STAP|nr:SepA family multidrug efflux transporter [Macrococcus hajekii]TDM01671.1 SepA family multidrug efflux transporter [Macrococcus hajekii]GGB13260.1 multidrug resistance efflux pump SepA [Macrococcus hajekii]
MKGFKFNFNTIITLSFMTGIFLVSGFIFLVLVSFGLFGLSRILLALHLAEFTYNQSFADNLFYYGSYIAGGFFLLRLIEFMFNNLKRLYPGNQYFVPPNVHVIIVMSATLFFYFLIHINYEHIKINFIVILLIIAILYALTEIFYPNSEDLNQNDEG